MRKKKLPKKMLSSLQIQRFFETRPTKMFGWSADFQLRRTYLLPEFHLFSDFLQNWSEIQNLQWDSNAEELPKYRNP
jgi:hypothetical protein